MDQKGRFSAKQNEDDVTGYTFELRCFVSYYSSTLAQNEARGTIRSIQSPAGIILNTYIMTIATNAAPTQWILRPSTMDDADAINLLFSISWNHLLVDHYGQELVDKTLPALEHVRAKNLLSCGTYYIVQHPTTQEIVGAGGWTWEHPIETGTDYAHIRHVASHPKFTRQGIGRAIWNHCWKQIVQESRGTPHTEVLSTIPARSFYERLGFQAQKEMGVPLDDDASSSTVTMLPCLYMIRKNDLELQV